MTFWNQRFVVTGGRGFLGSHLAEGLKARGAGSVYAPPKAIYDLRNEYDTRMLLDHHNPDVLIHAAATVGGIGANRQRPGDFFYDNMLMGVNLIHQAQRYGVSKIVLLGTVCSYPKYTPAPFNEDNLWNGYPEETNAPYGIAKKALLTMAQAYRAQYGTNIITLLPTNLYGPGDNFDPATSHVIPALIRKCLEARDSIEVWGDGSATRDFLYVTDAVDGILRAAEGHNDGAPVNLGSDKEISIGQLVEEIAIVTGFNGRIKWDQAQPNGQPRRVLSSERAFRAFAFVPVVSLVEGLRRTVEWYQQAHTMKEA